MATKRSPKTQAWIDAHPHLPIAREGSGGRAPFFATPEMRAAVKVYAGMRMTLEQIRLNIINTVTDKPISTHTLQKYFPAELEQGYASIKGLISRRYLERLNAGERWAIQAGLQQFFGWDGESPVEVVVNADGTNGLTAEFEHLVDSIAQARTIEGSVSETPAGQAGRDPARIEHVGRPRARRAKAATG